MAWRARRIFNHSRGPAAPPRPSQVGVVVDPLVGRAVDGGPLSVPIDADSRLVLAFLTSSCTSCRPFWTAAASHSGTAPALAPTPLVIVTPDPETEDRREVARLAPPGAAVIMSTAAWLALGVRGSPFFVVVAGGVVRAEGFASTWPAVVELIA